MGEKLQTQTSSFPVAGDLRMKETMFSLALLASIHWKPADSESASQSEFSFP
jgi:hypothetical protein